MKKVVQIASLALLVTGCAWQIPNTEYTRLSDKTYPSRTLDYPIKVFRTSLPEVPYEELGVAIADGGGMDTIGGSVGNSYQNAIDRLKTEARLKGGDAVIDIRESTMGNSAFVTLTASIVRWKK